MTTDDPLAIALLRHLATHRGPDDGVGSLARTVLAGQANLRQAATWSWHGDALARAYTEALRERDRMTAEQWAAYERDAGTLSAG